MRRASWVPGVPRGRSLVALLAGLAVLAGACTSTESDVTPTATAVSPTTAGTATATATDVAPTATATPTGPRVASTVWLVDAGTNEVGAVADNAGATIATAEFGPDGDMIVVRWGDETAAYDFDAKPVTSGLPLTCRDVSGGVDVGLRVYRGARCGLISPDEKWMYYTLETVPQQTYDAWLLNLESGQTNRIREALRHCGGCDGRFGPRWSASGRYVFFSELVQDGNVYLTNAETLATSVISSGTDLLMNPAWSPVSDELLIPFGGQAAILDAATGERRELQLAWPARWDSTGDYVYSPGWPTPPFVDTTLVDPVTGTALATLAGVPPWIAIWTDVVVLAGTGDDGYTAALEGATGCAGTMIWSTLRTDSICVEQGHGAAVSPDGTQVAVAVVVEVEAGPFFTPDSETPRTMSEYQVMIVEVASGVRNIVDADAYSYPAEAAGQFPPAITWNEQGTHILVRWPVRYGL